MDQVRHRAGRERPERRHRARADDVRVDLRRAPRVRRLPVVRVVDGDASRAPSVKRASDLVARAASGRRRARSRAPRSPARDAQTPTSQSARRGLESRRAYGRARGARYAEEDAHTRHVAATCGCPWTLRGTAASCRESSPAPRCSYERHRVVPELRRVRDVARAEGRRLDRSRRSPSRSGAPRFDEPAPRYVWQWRQPTCAKSSAPRCRRLSAKRLLLRPSRRHARDGLGAERLLRGRALLREHAHREDDEHRRDARPPAGASRRRSRATVDERQREQQDHQDRRDPDRAEDHRLRPLEDPEQVEEEVEVPVRPRDEVRRPRVGLVGVQRAELARVVVLVRR